MQITISFLLALAFGSNAFSATNHWVVTWGASASPQSEEAQMRALKLTYDNQTLREIVHASIGGEMVRVRLSNAFSKQAVEIGAAHLGISARGADVVPGSDHILTFSGRPTATIPANAFVVSDPLKLDLPSSGDVAVSLFLPTATMGGGIHYASQQTSYIGPGNLTASASMPDAEKVESWVFLSELDVMASEHASTLVAFGDSITDGAHSTIDANHRWPNFLAERLQARRGKSQIGILDAGIGGNRILHDAAKNIRFGVNALARFDQDVLAQPGVKYVVVMEGINDLGHPGTAAPESETVTVEDLIAGLKQLVDRAHENGVKIFGATLTPFAIAAGGYFTPDREVKRQALNQWIRTGGAFDGVIDFDKAAQDPQHPERMLPAFDSGDHLHPNDAGYKAMADAIDLALFR